MNYRLSVEFQHEASKKTIRGFFAADGNAAESSADSGSVWQVRFTPDQPGKWSYTARMHRGEKIALNDDLMAGEPIMLEESEGEFIVIQSYKEGPDFRGRGRLHVSDGYFKFEDEDRYFLKAGANSPENLLAYVGFDDTYRIEAEAREGEAAPSEDIHRYQPHLEDWKPGDPTWQNGKGKSLIGAINYLASKEMNAIYFITMNIGGDGKDVWPFRSPDDFTRFDLSKLDQWEIVFQHMQAKGILLHVVLQETENEPLLDAGDTGPTRQLYYKELIARFGHHLGLVWNLGEENGPADWSPIGQDDAQRKAMAKYLKEHDPYGNTVIIHTHSHDPLRSDILDDLLGYPYLDGISLQQDQRAHAADVTQTWKSKSAAAGQQWLVTMDEIGMWYTGALTDTADVDHPSLRGDVLWGTLLSGAAGIEWYFGGRHVQNDLTSENWKLRDRLWELTAYAASFFSSYLPYWDMEPAHTLVDVDGAYCLAKPSEIYALYLPKTDSARLNLEGVDGTFEVSWYDPLRGGDLQKGSIEQITGGGIIDLGSPPRNKVDQDWVVLVR